MTPRNAQLAPILAYFDRDQLYDLSKDPREQVNLAKNQEYAQKLAEMRAELQKQLNTLPGTFGDLKK